jgi:redox-sensing transcriptional repressor
MDREMEIPRPSLARLPIYYRRLLHALEGDEAVISSQALGEAAGVPAAQVRKDLSHLGEMGRAGIGYDAGELAVALQDFLGLGNDKEAVLAGAGHLGQALAAYPGFERYGLRISALFDVDAGRIGHEVSGKPVYALDQLAPVVRRHGVRMGILCVPADAAKRWPT